MRLAPEPPALLARLDPATADGLVHALRQAGLAALAIDLDMPFVKDRTSAHTVIFTDAGVTFTPRSGSPMEMGWPDLLAILPAMRAMRSQSERTEKTKNLSVGMAVITGGLILTRTNTKTVRSSQESTEQLILIHARDGRSAALEESELDFSCLGPDIQASSTANMARLAHRMREKAPGAFYDDRLLRLGRRPLPFVWGGLLRSDTSGTIDLLAELMRQALVLGLLSPT